METELVTCSCCGNTIVNNAEENVVHGERPYPDDEGFGMCVRCGGDKKAEGEDEAAVKLRIGWAAQVFFESRFEVVTTRLSPVNAAKFSKMSYAEKIGVVEKLVTRGAII